MNFIDNIKEIIKSNPKKTIILTEGEDPRVIGAIEKVLDYCNIIVIGKILNTRFLLFLVSSDINLDIAVGKPNDVNAINRLNVGIRIV